MSWRELPQFMEGLRAVDGVAARALETLVLTAARSGEIFGAVWPEIDTNAKTWIIPPHRMKGGREHRIPLVPRTTQILKEMQQYQGQHVFPGTKGGGLGESAFRKLLASLGHDVTVHGFRSSFRDWAGEATNFPREVCEAALAHATGDRVEQAYRRGDALEKRRRLMEAWASYCSRPATAGATVTSLRR
jgi:integrase